MKVRATKSGYIYLKLYKAGEVFTLKPYKTSDGKSTITIAQQFSKNWMEEVDPKTPSTGGARRGKIAPKQVEVEEDEPVLQDVI